MKSVREELHAAFPAEMLQQKKVQGGEITFVAWHDYVSRLNELCFGYWRSSSTVSVAGGRLIVGVTVELFEEETGWVGHTGLGDSDVEKTSWGGAFAEAFSQAFRRACAMHGLGLYLYKGEDQQPEAPDAWKTWKESKEGKAKLKIMADVFRSDVFTEADKEKAKAAIQARPNASMADTIIETLRETQKQRRKEEGEGGDPF